MIILNFYTTNHKQSILCVTTITPTITSFNNTSRVTLHLEFSNRLRFINKCKNIFENF